MKKTIFTIFALIYTLVTLVACSNEQQITAEQAPPSVQAVETAQATETPEPTPTPSPTPSPAQYIYPPVITTPKPTEPTPTPEPVDGTIRVMVAAPKADIFIDGKLVNEGNNSSAGDNGYGFYRHYVNATFDNISAGEHELRVVCPDHLDYTETIFVNGDKPYFIYPTPESEDYYIINPDYEYIGEEVGANEMGYEEYIYETVNDGILLGHRELTYFSIRAEVNDRPYLSPPTSVTVHITLKTTEWLTAETLAAEQEKFFVWFTEAGFDRDSPIYTYEWSWGW
jgi:hypothetical protein